MTLHLSIVLWLPLAFGAIGMFAPPKLAGRVALLGTLVVLAYAVVYLVDYDSARGGLQYVTDETWISELGIHYKLGVDGLNLLFIALTAITWVAATLWASTQDYERPRLFFFHLMLGETAVLGALFAQDLALFVLFFDLMLIPFFFLTGMWGGRNRIAATTKMVIYTLVGSLLMLTAAVATGVLAAQNSDGALSFAFSDLAARPLGDGTQNWIFLFFAAAFLVKMPAFPLHGWMPDAYRNMPLPALAVFSAVLSKVAAYGFLRVCVPLFPHAMSHYQTLLLAIALAGVLYGSAMAFTTTESRLILGYSSLAQLGFITLGIFALNPQGAQGAVLQAFNHGLVVAPAFFIVALLAARAGGSEDIRDMGGIAMRAPVLAAMFLIVAFATLAMPGSSNFVGEFLILLGVFKTKLVFSIVAFAGVVMASVYALRLYIRTMHNRTGPRVESREMTLRDGLVLVPLVLAILAISVYPQFALKRTEKTVTGGGTPASAAQVAGSPAP
ncbi:MAG: NADH-quinone oxidoreductase subunit [Solirubrobacteraceae bacterium]|jgi:NADH-quinone oxidoreductase subunit M|nr:NADH-quinone oxidoreductase subunit [Solirubrobacteraceae bacterium]